MLNGLKRLQSRNLFRINPSVNSTGPKSLSSNVESVESAYTCYESTNVNSSKLPLLILHALLGSKNNKEWDSMAKALHKATGRMIINVDARNHGDSQHSFQHTYTHMAQDVIKLLQKLQISKVSILGHSMGGHTAMLLSLLHSHLVSSLIVVEVSPISKNPLATLITNVINEMICISITSGTTMVKARELADEQLKNVTSDAKLRSYLISNLVQTNTGSYTWKVNLPALKENLKYFIEFPSNLEGLQYTGPTLFIGGSKSNFIRKNELPELQEYFPLAELVFIEGGGHWVQNNKLDIFTETVRTFLSDKI